MGDLILPLLTRSEWHLTLEQERKERGDAERKEKEKKRRREEDRTKAEDLLPSAATAAAVLLLLLSSSDRAKKTSTLLDRKGIWRKRYADASHPLTQDSLAVSFLGLL